MYRPMKVAGAKCYMRRTQMTSDKLPCDGQLGLKFGVRLAFSRLSVRDRSGAGERLSSLTCR